MYKLECDIIKDLIPLYIENIASEGSSKEVEYHIKTCDNCKKILDQMKRKAIVIDKEEVEPLMLLKKRIKHHIIKIIGLSIFLSISVYTLISGLLMKSGEEFGYVIFYMYFVLPLTSLICSIILGTEKRKYIFFLPIFFTILGHSIFCITFSNLYFELSDILLSGALFFVPSMIGLSIGFLIKKVRHKVNKKMH